MKIIQLRTDKKIIGKWMKEINLIYYIYKKK